MHFNLCIFVRVLSLLSSVIHGFVTEPWHSRHVIVLMWVRGFETARAVCSRLRVLFHVGAWGSDPGTHVLLSFGFLSGTGHSRSMFCLVVGVCGLQCFVLLHAAWFSLAACCLVWTRGWWVCSLAACLCLVQAHGLWLVCWPCACVFVLC